MEADGVWRVIVHNDEVNSFMVVVHLVQTLCGASLEDAARMTADVHNRGAAEVSRVPDQTDAEQLVIELQRHGLHATLRRP